MNGIPRGFLVLEEGSQPDGNRDQDAATRRDGRRRNDHQVAQARRRPGRGGRAPRRDLDRQGRLRGPILRGRHAPEDPRPGRRDREGRNPARDRRRRRGESAPAKASGARRPRVRRAKPQADGEGTARSEEPQRRPKRARRRSREGTAGRRSGQRTGAETRRGDGRLEGARQRSGRGAASPDDTSKRGIISPLVRRLADENKVDLERGRRHRNRRTHPQAGRASFRRGAQGPARPPRPRTAQRSPLPSESRARSRLRAAKRALRPSSRRARGARSVDQHPTPHRRAHGRSSREVARAWNAVEADWTNIANLRAGVKDKFKEVEGFGLTYMPFLAKAICDTLLEMPEVNATYDEENQANLVKHYVNLGIAVALEGGGLIVPVIKGADEKNLVGLARGRCTTSQHALAPRSCRPTTSPAGPSRSRTPARSARSSRCRSSREDRRRSSASKRSRSGSWSRRTTRSRSVTWASCTMSWDHRTIDGAEAAQFLARLRERIETTDFSSELAQYAVDADHRGCSPRPGSANVDYAAAWSWQRELFLARLDGERDDSLMLLEHPPTYTLGRRALENDLVYNENQRAARGIVALQRRPWGPRDVSRPRPARRLPDPGAGRALRRHQLPPEARGGRDPHGRRPGRRGPPRRGAHRRVGRNEQDRRDRRQDHPRHHDARFRLQRHRPISSMFEGIVPCGIQDRWVTSVHGRDGPSTTP